MRVVEGRFIRLCVALFLIIQFGALAQTKSARVGDLERDAQAALSAGHPDAAIADYQAALRLNPSNEKLCLGLGFAYKQVFNYDEAREVLTDCSARHPKSGAALMELADIDFHAQHYDEAIKTLRQAVKRSPSSPRAHVELGAAYQAKGDSDDARKQFNRAIQLDPRSASAYYFRGELYAEREDNPRAEADARKAMSLAPAVEDSRLLLAKVLTRAGQCAEAAELLKPLADPSRDPKNQYELARAYQCSGQPDLATTTQAEFERRSRQEQEQKTQRMEADHLADQAADSARNNQLPVSLDLLNQALAKDPQNIKAHAVLAKIEFSRGNIPAARQAIDVALGGDPYNPDYLYVLGKTLEKQDDWNGALQTFHKTTVLNPRESDAYFEISQIYLHNGDRPRAIAALRNAVKYSPDDPDYRKALHQLLATQP
jgi:tetratricopeptide (TPR) repeat protein